MTPGKFLRLIWPDTGFYCIAHPFKPAGSTVTTYVHKVFPTISEAVTHVHEQANLQDVYFAILSLEQAQVWDANKDNHKTGGKGAWAYRTQENMLASKASFFDLDVGSDAGKYPTQRDALAGLITFLDQTKLPMPTLVSSGGGVHVYWHYDHAIPAAEWRTLAWHMRQLAEHLKLKVDPTRTIDSTSVLRVPDTYNWKDRANPRPVKVLQEGAITPVAMLRQIVSDAMITYGVTPTEAPTRRAGPPAALPEGLAPQRFEDFGPPPTLEELGDVCGQVREMIRSQTDAAHPHYGPLDNTAWYRGMLATIKHVEDGDGWCRKLTALHPRTNADIDAKLHQLEQYPPAKCATLQQFMPWKDTPCQGCRFRDKVPNPLAAARKGTPAPPPSSNAPPLPQDGAGAASAGLSSAAPTPPAPSAAPVLHLVAPSPTLGAALLPNPPKPYERLKAGGIAITRTDKDGNSTTSVIYPHDLYPVKRLTNEGEQREQQVWRVTLPRSGAREFTIDADVLYDSRKFCVAIANNGIYPNKADIPALQDYMVAYISQLQKEIDADAQTNHLGWAGEHQRFIMPDKVLMADGTVKASALSLGAARAAQFVRKAGDLNTQRQLLGFYDRPEYLANQFVILSSLASIIFDLTGHHGIVVNCSGDPGASKSTTLYTAASLWGDPVLWPINGTNRGATANARMQRMSTNANLPTCVDEITHMPIKEVQDMVMGVSQPGHRLRLTTDGVERKVEDSYKSSIMIATANASLHSLLSTDNAAGTAGSMRVFEMRFKAQKVHSKAEADEFLRQIKQHYGHIGEVFAHFVVRHRDMVAKRVHQVMEEVDVEAHIRSSERFWSAIVAVVYVAGEIAQALQLLPYDPMAVRQWAIGTQIPYMRGIVRDEYRDPLAILSDYIAEKHGSIVVVDRTTSIGANTSGQAVATDSAWARNRPNSSLLGHYDLSTGVLYLLKNGFKDHCSKIGASGSRVLEELAGNTAGGKLILEKSVRRTLGAGTELAKGQAWCIAIDMKHPDMSGAAPALAASGGAPTAPATGHLQVVK